MKKARRGKKRPKMEVTRSHARGPKSQPLSGKSIKSIETDTFTYKSKGKWSETWKKEARSQTAWHGWILTAKEKARKTKMGGAHPIFKNWCGKGIGYLVVSGIK